MVLGALAIPRLWPRRAPRVALLMALGWTVISAAIIHPDHLTYFNELALGRGYRYLGDSNLDWGQDLTELAAYAGRYRAETGRPLHFSYTGAVDREHYGLAGPSIIEQFNRGEGDFAPANPAAGRYAINAGDLQGTGLILGELRESDLFDWFRRREPLATLGGSIFVYEVPERPEGDWIAHCATPGRLVDDAQAERLLGREALRHVEFDCRTNWVFPGGPGWYILPPDGTEWLSSWLEPDDFQEIYRHRANAYGPDYRIAYWPGTLPNDAPDLNLSAYAGQIGGPAELRGFGVNGAEWVTLWHAIAPAADPLSVKAHLLAGDGGRQVADGLGFASGQWRAGDWFLQRHLFAVPGDSLETGLYNYVTLESTGPAHTLIIADE